MLKGKKQYPCSPTDEQWKIIRVYIPSSSSSRGRKRRVDIREVLDAIFYVARTGCAWRYLPHDFPNWHTVYDYYRSWLRLGVIQKITDELVKLVRIKDGRSPYPTLGIVDSQSIKAQFGKNRGYDGFKKVRGRKRNILVDALGMPLSVYVDSASTKDHFSAEDMFFQQNLKTKLNHMTDLLADGGYRANVSVFDVLYNIEVKISSSKNIKDIKQARTLTESNLTPMRWIVERTFAWLNNFRRLSRDYERNTKSSQAMTQLALIHLMLDRLVQTSKPKRWT